jgi:tripartite-type tricarboxylate transporter receptor subunit TctC
MGQWLSEKLGQQFIVENRTGAGGNIGTEAAVRAPPDGYTLHVTAIPDAINATLYEKLNFNIVRDLAPVGGISRGFQILLLHPSLAIKTLPELITYVKSRPGSPIASGGTGTPGHLTGELFKRTAGLEMVHVPYRGEALAYTDMISGHLQIMFASASTSIELVKTGKLSAIAVTTAERVSSLPDVSTMAETISGFELINWAGMSAPKGTPPEIINKLNAALNEGLANPKIKSRCAEVGSIVFPTSPAEFGKFVADETEKLGKVIRAAGIKAE